MTLTPVMDTARLRCYKAPPSSRYLGNGLSDRKLDGGPGFEGRGILVIAVCGLYAIFLFLAARAVSYIFKKVTAPGIYEFLLILKIMLILMILNEV